MTKTTPQRFFSNAVDLSGSINQSSLCRKLGVSTGCYSDWKKGRNYPSDTTMIKLAELCKIDPVEALALLNLWRCNEEAKAHYETLFSRLIVSGVKSYIFLFILASWGNMDKAYANQPLNPSPAAQNASEYNHYAIIREAINQLFTKFFNFILNALRHSARPWLGSIA